MRGRYIIILGIIFSTFNLALFAQNDERIPKVHHAEPLYYDLVRDLGARKGEREINIGAEFINYKNYTKYGLLAEYEFAPVDRLGLEVEVDFSFFRKTNKEAITPTNTMDALRLSSQYSFFVSPKIKTTLALGYTQIFEFIPFDAYGKQNFFSSTVYNPFFIAAKCWGKNFHTLIYAGPLLEHNFERKNLEIYGQINTSFMYTIPNTHHFVGIEFNKEIINKKFEMTIRPQVKIHVHDRVSVGIVAGFPVLREGQGFSSFFRLIIEP